MAQSAVDCPAEPAPEFDAPISEIDETVADAVIARHTSVTTVAGREVVIDTVVFDDPLGETEWHSASYDGHVVEIATHPVFPTVVRIDSDPVPTGDGLEDLAGAFALVARHLEG